MHGSRTEVNILHPQHNATTGREASHLRSHQHLLAFHQASHRRPNTEDLSEPLQVAKQLRQRQVMRPNAVTSRLIHHPPDVASTLVAEFLVASFPDRITNFSHKDTPQN